MLIALFAGYTIASVIGMVLLKHSLPLAQAAWQNGTPLSQPLLLVGVGAALYISSFLIWLLILLRSELTSALPTAIGLTLVFSTIGANLFLGESVHASRIVGMLLIFAGIWLVM